MPDGLVLAAQTPGLWALLITMAVAGVVRGFTGFGTALIFVPVAGRYLPPGDVIFLMTVTGVASNITLLPRALRDGAAGEVGMLVIGAAITIPLGLWAMSVLDAQIIRWIVAGAAAVTLGALVSGWRYRGTVRRTGLPVIGSGAGFLGGMTGLTGPVVILFYLAGARPVQMIRGNTILFLAALDLLIAASILVSGLADPALIWLGALLSVPYLATSLIGQRLFDPTREAVYRLGAYVVIGCAVLRGLPVWG